MTRGATRATRFNTHAVRGCPGWWYGLKVQRDYGTVVFALNGPGGAYIPEVKASGYRTTTMARRMGDKRRGYQHEAQLAIKAYERTD